MADLGRPITLSFDISKVDTERRYVGGYATTELPDKQDDIVDYQGSVEAFGQWPGNVREQHDKHRAVGKAIEVRPEPDTKRIWVGAYISRSRDGEDTLTKVKEGILKGFSIKGQVLESRPETLTKGDERRTVNRVTRYRLDELSLVDNPANPEALIRMVKSADGKSVATDVLAKRDFDPNVGGGVDRDKLDEADFAGPDRSFPIKTPGDVSDAAHSLGQTKHDKDAVKRRIISIARRKGPEFVAELPEEWKGGEEEKVATPTDPAKTVEKAADVDVERLADILNDLAQTVSANPGDPAYAPLRAAIAAIAQALASTGPTPAPPVAPGLTAGGAIASEGALAGPPPEEMPPPPPAEEEKAAAGSTLTKDAPAGAPWGPGGDDDKDEGEDKGEEKPEEKEPEKKAIEIQQLHDLSVALGAQCKDSDKGEEKAEPKEQQGQSNGTSGMRGGQMMNDGQPPWQGKGMGHDETLTLVREEIGRTLQKAQTSDLEKLETARETLTKATEELGRLQKEVAGRLEALEKRLAVVENSPAPTDNAPALRAVQPGLVEKSLGETPDGGALEGLTQADAVALSKALDKAKNPFVKQHLGYALAYLEMRKT